MADSTAQVILAIGGLVLILWLHFYLFRFIFRVLRRIKHKIFGAPEEKPPQEPEPTKSDLELESIQKRFQHVRKVIDDDLKPAGS